MDRLLAIGAFALTLAFVSSAAAEPGPQIFVVHVDAHADLDGDGTVAASALIIDLAHRLRDLSMLEFRVFGAIEKTRWQLVVSAGQGERGTLVTRFDHETTLPTASHLADSIGAYLDRRTGTQISLWPLQQLVGAFASAPPDRKHQLLRLVAGSQPSDPEKNGLRVLLLHKRVDTWVAAADSDAAPSALEAEGWRPASRPDAVGALTRGVAELLEVALAHPPDRWGACGEVVVGSSLVDIVAIGATGGGPPADVLSLAGTAAVPSGWDISVSRMNLVRLDAIPNLSGVRASVTTRAQIICRYDSRVQPAWNIVRDGNLFDGVRVFRGERLVVQAKASPELNAAHLVVAVGRDGGTNEPLCGLTQALDKGCAWQPGKTGEHALTLLEPSGKPWRLLATHRSVKVVEPLAVSAEVALKPSVCADSDTAIPFEGQSHFWSVPASLCVDYEVKLTSSAFTLTTQQRSAALSALRVQVAKGEHVVREVHVDPKTGIGQAHFSLGDDAGEPVIGAGPISVRVASSRTPPVFRDAVADVTYALAFGGAGPQPLELSDLRPLAYGLVALLILAIAAAVVWLLVRSHHVHLRFGVRGWPEHVASAVQLRIGGRRSDSTDGLRPVLGLERIAARRVLTGYELTFVLPAGRSAEPIVVRPGQTRFEWGPFDVTITRVRPANA